MRGLLPLVLVAATAACSHTAGGCGPHGDPPYPRVSGSRLLTSSPKWCPLARPATDAPCTPPVASTPNAGEQTFCLYAAPSRGLCEVDRCDCRRASPVAPPTWFCSRLVE